MDVCWSSEKRVWTVLARDSYSWEAYVIRAFTKKEDAEKFIAQRNEEYLELARKRHKSRYDFPTLSLGESIPLDKGDD